MIRLLTWCANRFLPVFMVAECGRATARDLENSHSPSVSIARFVPYQTPTPYTPLASAPKPPAPAPTTGRPPEPFASHEQRAPAGEVGTTESFGLVICHTVVRTTVLRPVSVHNDTRKHLSRAFLAGTDIASPSSF